MAAGLTVAFGHDCAVDPFYPIGSGDMLGVASMGLHVAHMTGRDGMRAAFDAVAVNGAKLMGLEGCELEPGCHADFVVRQARDPIEMIRLRAARLQVVRRSTGIAESPPQTARLHPAGAVRQSRISHATGCKPLDLLQKCRFPHVPCGRLVLPIFIHRP